MTETFSLRSHLDTVRQQLSHSLYQHDAACRVIARLVKERDGLRHQLSQIQDQVSHSIAQDVPLAGGTVAGDIGLSSDVIEEWKTLAKSLLNQRKKRSLEGLTPIDKIKLWKECGSFSTHSSTTPGEIDCLFICLIIVFRCCLLCNGSQTKWKFKSYSLDWWCRWIGRLI